MGCCRSKELDEVFAGVTDFGAKMRDDGLRAEHAQEHPEPEPPAHPGAAAARPPDGADRMIISAPVDGPDDDDDDADDDADADADQPPPSARDRGLPPPAYPGPGAGVEADRPPPSARDRGLPPPAYAGKRGLGGSERDR